MIPRNLVKMKRIIFFLFVTVFICSCSKNALKQFQEGDTLGSYKTLYKKAKKDKLNRDERNLFKKVVSKLITEDSTEYYRLVAFEGFESDKKAYQLFSEMDERKEEIDRLNMYLKNYDFLDYKDYDQLSRNITEAMFVEADNLLTLSSSSGNRLDAQEAYEILEEMKNYHTYLDYEVDEMQDVALDLGIEYVLVNFVNRAFGNSFTIDKYSDFNDLDLYNSKWRVYHENQGFVQYICIADVIIDRARFFNNEIPNTQNYSKEIVTGHETQIDSSGKTTKTEITETVYATVTEREIRRTLTIEGEIEFRMLNGSRFDENISRSYSETIIDFSYTGDIRAIPNNVQNDINSNASFSSDDNFFRILMDDFLESAGDIIKDVRY